MLVQLKKSCCFLFGVLFLLGFATLQVSGQEDTNFKARDTVGLMQDSILVKDTLWLKYTPIIPNTFINTDAWFLQSFKTAAYDSNFNLVQVYHQYYKNKKNGYRLYNQKTSSGNAGDVFYKIEQKFSLPNKDVLFYTIIGLLFIYGFIINMFPQYIPKLFSQFSQSSLRIMQHREQLLQNNFASLTMNISFVMSFSLLATLVIFNGHLLPINFWEAYLYMCIFFVLLYVGKYICLTLAGYIFNTKELVQTYIFVVFMINKVLGMLLFPFILMLTFSKPSLHTFAFIGAGFLIFLLILYRYLFSLTSVRNKLHISSFHFFLYLCAFEVLPILILYKLIVQYFGGTF